METICKGCTQTFKTRSRKRKFCSHPCYATTQRGKPRNLDQRGSKNHNWKGGRRTDKDGYIIVHVPYHPFCDSDGYVREHRLVMEKQIKRFLLSQEVVHHLNELKADNRIENLQLMTKQEHDRHNAIERIEKGFRLPKRTTNGQWSISHSQCIKCKETRRMHRGKGLCGRCYQQK